MRGMLRHVSPEHVLSLLSNKMRRVYTPPTPPLNSLPLFNDADAVWIDAMWTQPSHAPTARISIVRPTNSRAIVPHVKKSSVGIVLVPNLRCRGADAAAAAWSAGYYFISQVF